MLKTRWIALGTALALIAASFIVGRKAGGSRELVWAIGAIQARPGGPADDIVAAWNQIHPNGPTVRIEALPNSADDQREQMALELEAKSSEFDILSLDVIWTGEFARNNWLIDLEDIRAPIEQASLPGPLASATWNRKLWAAPNTTNAPFLYYRTDLVPHPPATWQELVEVGLEAGQKNHIAPFVGQGARYEGMVVSYLEYLWGAGGNLFNADGTKVLFDEASALKALEFMRTAQERKVFAPGFNTMKEEEARATFQAGEAVFMRNWPYAYELMSGRDPRNPSKVSGKFDIAPLPSFDGHDAVSGLGGNNLAVSRFSDNVEAAKDFVLFAATTPDVQRMLAKKHSLAPTMASLYKEPNEGPVMDLLGRILPNGRSRPATPEWTEISNKIQEHIYASYNDDEDPRTAVEAVRTFLEAKVAKG